MIGFITGLLRVVSYLLAFHAGLVIGHGGADAGTGPIWILLGAVLTGTVAGVVTRCRDLTAHLKTDN